MKEKIKEFVLEMGVDDVGIAAVKDYKSPRSPDLLSIFPEAKSFVVLAHKEQKKMVRNVNFWRLYQAGFIGFQYFCFNCFKSCPVWSISILTLPSQFDSLLSTPILL
jgi:hypothetical protein